MRHNIPRLYEGLIKERNPFFVIEGTIYVAGLPKTSGDAYYRFGNVQFPLNPVSSDREQRDLFLELHKDSLEGKLTTLVKEHTNLQIAQQKKKLERSSSYVSAKKKYQVHRLYADALTSYHKDWGVQSVPIPYLQMDSSLSRSMDVPGIERVKQHESPLQGHNSGVLANSWYTLQPNAAKENGYVFHQGIHLGLVQQGSAKRFLSRYAQQIEHSLEQTAKLAKPHTKQFEQLTSFERSLKRWEQSLDRDQNKERYPFKIVHIDNNKYELITTIKPFISNINGKYYVFSSSKKGESKQVLVTTKLTIDDVTVSVQEPYLASMPYHHPFVYSDARICFNGIGRFSQEGIHFGKKYDLTDTTLPKKLADLARFSESILTSSYKGSNVLPVHRISNYQPIAHSLQEARLYADAHQIPYRRIMA